MTLPGMKRPPIRLLHRPLRDRPRSGGSDVAMPTSRRSPTRIDRDSGGFVLAGGIGKLKRPRGGRHRGCRLRTLLTSDSNQIWQHPFYNTREAENCHRRMPTPKYFAHLRVPIDGLTLAL